MFARLNSSLMVTLRMCGVGPAKEDKWLNKCLLLAVTNYQGNSQQDSTLQFGSVKRALLSAVGLEPASYILYVP